MRKLYVVTKPLFDENNELKQHLIGVLTELSEENYAFEYKLKGIFHKNFLKIFCFDDPNKIYTGKEVEAFTTIYAPKSYDRYFGYAMHGANLKETDEWALLVHYGALDGAKPQRLLETLPEGVIIYDDI